MGGYRRVIHHELNHNIDYTIRHYFFNRDWHALNPPGFQYGAPLYDANGEPVITWARPGFSNPVPGFVDFYSTSNYTEDYAQIGSGVFGTRQAQLMDICQKDPIVNAKVKLYIEEIRRFWPFPSRNDDTFWKAKMDLVSTACH
ncbi:hypothetical protein LEP1GSC188_0754 [Leptospira weilii serovar Topaz str. LT2116]|uniref:Uncharacterized protein n=1 Tax=Leptospira weilii serovar Topaz str. LT2116 TaxID=1088540 RepID=M3G7H6_9LEPT|nr:hypothetical protein LEP1GSC188_0754 [Leptospira weilii serovar Topaz str. LT2116]